LSGPAAADRPSIGLALGGGGARGFAHLKVIEAFDEIGLTPAAIAGTSIGALIGAARASGISGREATERARALIGSRRRAIRQLLTSRPAGLAGLFAMAGAQGAILNAESVVAVVLPELGAADFDALAIPTSIVATDFHARAARVFDSGPLKPALAASIALPGLFSPVDVAGRFHVDGGLTNPLPYDVIAPRCDITVAVDVTMGKARHAPRRPGVADVLFGSLQIMLGALVAARIDANPPDILIRPPVEEFRLIDMFSFERIVAAADPVKDTLKRELDRAVTAFERKRTGA